MKKILLIFLAVFLAFGCSPCFESDGFDSNTEESAVDKLFEPPLGYFNDREIDLIYSTDLSTIEGMFKTDAYNKYAEALTNYVYNARGQIVQTTLDEDKKIFTYQLRLRASMKFASEPDALDTAIRNFITKKEDTSK